MANKRNAKISAKRFKLLEYFDIDVHNLWKIEFKLSIIITSRQ